MTNEEYQELNNYLSLELNNMKNDYFFLENIEIFKYINDKYYEVIEKYDISSNYNNLGLSDDDIYLLAHEIVESISPKYVELLEQLKNNNGLYISDNNIIINNKYVLNDSTSLILPDKKIIFIKKKGNYSDVKQLVHELIHCTSKNEHNIKRYILGEFLSIYFEQYAEEFLKNKDIKDESVKSNDRIISTYNRSVELSYFINPLIIYLQLHEINIENIEYINKDIIKISKEELEMQCKKLLNAFRKYSDQKKGIVGYNHFSVSFQYLFATLLSFYATKNCKLEDMINLNEHIDDKDELFIIDTLQNIGIDFEKEHTIENLFNCIEEYIQRENNKVIK